MKEITLKLVYMHLCVVVVALLILILSINSYNDGYVDGYVDGYNKCVQDVRDIVDSIVTSRNNHLQLNSKEKTPDSYEFISRQGKFIFSFNN